MTRNSDPVHQDHLLALLGVLWRRQERHRDCPPDTELAALFDGVLPQASAERTRAHLLDCPQCYRSLLHWSEVSDIVDDSPRSRSPRPSTWLGVVAAAASLVLAVTVLLMPRHEPWQDELATSYGALGDAVSAGTYQPPQSGWIWRPGYGSRGFGAPSSPTDTAARTAFTVGVAQGLDAVTSTLDDWLELRSDLALVRTRCGALASGECTSISELYTHVGRWATLMHFACEPLHAERPKQTTHPFADDAFWHRHVAVLEQIAQRAQQAPRADGYTRLFGNWLARLDADAPATLCRGVPPLLSTMDR